MRRSVVLRQLGLLPYRQAWDAQLVIREAIKRGEGPEHLLLLEHPHVYTLGRNAEGVDVLASREWLAEHQVELVHTDRGGQVTYHGPGQLVGYPILNLSPDRRDVRRYVRDLSEVLVRTLADFDIVAQAGEEQALIGAWVGRRKIASIGVHLSRWITTHGFALNVSTDLSFFQRIVPCGLASVEMVSIEKLTGQAPTVAEVGQRLGHHFATLFERQLVVG
jgi:lipoate-protein ligase B